MATPRFSDVKVGDTLAPIAHVVSQEVIDRYAVGSLDYNPVHTDIEWAQRARVFGMPCTVGHGMFTMSLMASVVLRSWGCDKLWVKAVETKFTKPVEVGQELRCWGVVKELHPIGTGKNYVRVELQAATSGQNTVAVGFAEVVLPD
jgi:acyl dehydratase